MPNGVKRVALTGVTLLPADIERLDKVAEDRALGKSKLVERALGLLWVELDQIDKANAPAKPGPS